MTKSGRHDYDSVRAARSLRALPRRRIVAMLLAAATVVGASLVVRALTESAAQLRGALAPSAAVAPAPALREDDLRPSTAPDAGTESPAEIAPEALAAAIERAEAAVPGPPSAHEFARLVESGLLGDADHAAVEELRRQLEAARAR